MAIGSHYAMAERESSEHRGAGWHIHRSCEYYTTRSDWCDHLSSHHESLVRPFCVRISWDGHNGHALRKFAAQRCRRTDVLEYGLHGSKDDSDHRKNPSTIPRGHVRRV